MHADLMSPGPAAPVMGVSLPTPEKLHPEAARSSVEPESLPMMPETPMQDSSDSDNEVTGRANLVTRATQLGCKKFLSKIPRRSRGTQVKRKMVSVGVQCCLLQDTPTAEDTREYEEVDLETLLSDSDDDDDDHVSDMDYVPGEDSSDSDDQDILRPRPYTSQSSALASACQPDLEDKFIVFKSQLLQLFQICDKCHKNAVGEIAHAAGTLIQVTQTCQHCNHIKTWNSQPYIGKMPAGNLLLSGAILFAGCHPVQTLRMLDHLGVATISQSTFFRHQSKYLQPTVINVWKKEQGGLVQEIKEDYGGKVILAADGRSDSPGHCAKYGSYTCIEQQLNKVLDVQVVQSNEVKNATWCELEGLKRLVDWLKAKELDLNTIITDRHKQNAKWIRENLTTRHFYDVWHIAKSLLKKLTALAGQKDCEDLKLWLQSIVNHLYWVAASTPGGEGETMTAKWESLVHHIQDVHVDLPNLIYPACSHPALEGNDRMKQWLRPNSKVAVKLEEILMAKSLISDISKMSPEHQTSSLEAFHSLILRFAPKNTSFSNLGMRCRHYLAALHYNENSNRELVVNEEGRPRLRVRFPKFKKGGWSAHIQRADPTYGYASHLLSELVTSYRKDPAALEHSVDELRQTLPPPLSAGMVRPDMAEVEAQFSTRYPHLMKNQ